MINLDHIEQTDTNSDILVKIYQETKSKTTQGKLRTIDNHIYINNSHVITAAGRLITPEEQMANLDLWVLVKENNIVESLHYLKNVYKAEAIKMSRLYSFFVFTTFILLLSLISLIYYKLS